MSSFLTTDYPVICLITKGNLTPQSYIQESDATLSIIKSAAESNISLIQIREKKLPAKLVFELVTKALEITKDHKTKILVNDRFDIAIAAKADGVHLTSNSIPTKIIRKLCLKDFIIGVSTHTFEEAKTAKNEGANFITFSPIFHTTSKENFEKPKGLEELKNVCDKLKTFPVLALGGIDESNFRSTISNGARGFAGISFFNDVTNLGKLDFERLILK